jgi:excisionase family DNA binding protein
MRDGDLVTLTEAGEILRLKTSTLRAWVLRRKIPYCKVGRLVRLRRADVEALIAESVVPARPEKSTETKLQPKVNSNADQTPEFFPQS